MLSVRLLGGVDLYLGDRQLAPLDSARAESLLAYLLLHRDAPQQRQHLAFKLWPDSTESQARTNLRHVLHNLRRALPDADRFIEATPRTLGWRLEAPLRLDVAAFEQAVAEGCLEEALETYAGELLEGSYDDWVLEERERLSQLHRDALERLARELEGEGRLDEAIRCADLVLHHDPLREETYRQLMRLYDASGDRARALRTYHVCATTLVRELGVEPSAATRADYEALLEIIPEDELPGTAPTATLTGASLVGRQAERARLAELWRSADSGRAHLVLVSGEAGIGKSRLVDELRSWCTHAGAVTAEARAYPAEGAMAYGVMASWLRSERIASRLRRLDHAHLSELARVVPELLSEIRALSAPEPLPEDEQRQRLFAAAARAIVSAGTPLLLVADDIHWCDLQTLQFVHYLLRTAPEARLLLAATARREEVDADHPLSQLVAGLRTLDVITEIGLGRLNRDEAALLGERVTGGPLDAAEVDRLYEESEGNPLFLIEALRAEPGVASAPREGMSDRVQAVISSRLAQLSEAAAGLIGVAAAIGREFTTQVLADASEASEEVLVRGLDELWRRGLVRAHGPGAYDFSHGKVREAAYRALSPAKARHHHLGIAAALERAGDLDAVSGQIAAHLEAAGAANEAIAWHLRAAEASQRLYASAEAVRSLERALALVGELHVGTERDTLELRVLTEFPAPLVAVEGYLSKRVADVHRRVLELAQSLEVEPEPPLARSLALAALTRGEFEAACPFGKQLRARAERDRDDVLWVESAYVLGLLAYWQGQLEAARTEFQAAVERYRPEHRSAHLLRYGQDPQVFCQMRLAHTLWLQGRGDEAERERAAALARAERLGHPYSRTVAEVWAAILALDQGDEERLRHHVHALESDERAPEAGPTRVVTDAFVRLIDVLDGAVEAGEERVRAALAESPRGEPTAPGINGILLRTLVEACAKGAQPQAGMAVADEALATGGGAELWEAEVRRQRAGFLEALGAAQDEVGTELAEAIKVAERQGARTFELRARESLDRLRTGTL